MQKEWNFHNYIVQYTHERAKLKEWEIKKNEKLIKTFAKTAERGAEWEMFFRIANER